MEHYATDDEQVEAIKKWWQENGKSIIIGIAMGLAAVLGWQYWGSYRVSQAEQASAHYDALSQALVNADADRARQQGQVLLEDYDGSLYAILATLQLAKLAVDEGDNAAAIEHLQWALEHVGQDELKAIARLRLARVLLAEGRLDDAETQLDQITDINFSTEREELKGDLYLARNQPAKARAAYTIARAAQAPGQGELLQMKIDNLPPPAEEQAEEK